MSPIFVFNMYHVFFITLVFSFALSISECSILIHFFSPCFLRCFLGGCSRDYHICLIRIHLRFTLHSSEIYKCQSYITLFPLLHFITSLLYILHRYWYKPNSIIATSYNFKYFKEAERKNKYIFMEFVTLTFSYAIFNFFHLFLWIQVTIWCHFSHSIQFFFI